MSSLDDSLRIVIDAGSHSTKSGFAYESAPRSLICTAVGRCRHAGIHDGMPQICCGNEALKQRGLLDLVMPVRDGLICDWDQMEKLWHHIYYKELKVPPEESSLMHTMHALMPKKDKEDMAEMMFETFTVKALYMVRTPVAVLYASGRTTGVVWENGSACSCVTPIFEGFHLGHAASCSPVTGDYLTDLLGRMMEKIGYSFKTPTYRTILESIKAKMCYVAQDYTSELELNASTAGTRGEYELPDGEKVLLGDERFQCPECIFRPSLEGINCPGLVELICSSISRCDVDCRPMLYDNIVPSGGSSMFQGLVSRLSNDMKKRLPGVKVQVDDLPSRQFAQWGGASVLASMDDMNGFWMTRKDYQDLGPDAVNYKFF
ncbi:unnamed protein product [Chilo suppressalis]|uniref:Actin n=1 Tax=Chilo suppressalis TaxID=168631 RepID=A0ABN8AUB8_CHISP|nr:unnamed protein product [Chilo suppressalis]